MATEIMKDKLGRIRVTTDVATDIQKLVSNQSVKTKKLKSRKGTYRAFFGKKYVGTILWFLDDVRWSLQASSDKLY